MWSGWAFLCGPILAYRLDDARLPNRIAHVMLHNVYVKPVSSQLGPTSIKIVSSNPNAVSIASLVLHYSTVNAQRKWLKFLQDRIRDIEISADVPAGPSKGGVLKSIRRTSPLNDGPAPELTVFIQQQNVECGRIIIQDGDRALHLAEMFAKRFKRVAKGFSTHKLAESIERIAQLYARRVLTRRQMLLSSAPSNPTITSPHHHNSRI